MKTTTKFIYFGFASLALACFTLSPTVRAVVPAPDGGYPSFTTAEGTNALLHHTSGAGNTGLGWSSLLSVTTGSFNTAVGAGTLLANTADLNTATGAGALLSNTTATGNTAIGAFALFSNTTGGTLGNFQGVDFGPNVAVGWQALESNTIASANTAVGYQALRSFTSGPPVSEELGANTAVGFQALANATGIENVAVGAAALSNDTIGQSNTAVGMGALRNTTTGSGNVAVGAFAGQHVTEGDNNVILGPNAGANVSTTSNVICIGVNVGGDNVGNSCYIGNIFGATASGGVPVFINPSGKLGINNSSQRFKEQIRAMDEASEAVFALKPVTFRYKKDIDPAGTSQFGLVAEDVEKVNPDLVVRDKEGKPYSVRYDQVNAMLLNEFLKEHQTVQEQGATITRQRKDFEAAIAQQQKQIEALTAGLQKVSAQLELSKPAPKRAVTNR
jgi:hypothetical protein